MSEEQAEKAEKKELAIGVFELPNGNIEVETKQGVFEIEDVESGVSDNAIKRNKGSEHYGLFSVMVKKRDGKDVKMGEMEFTKLLTSTVTRLKKGIGFLIDAEEMQDFLSKQK